MRCAVVPCPGQCLTGDFWCERHGNAVSLADRCYVALARTMARRARLGLIEGISRKLEVMNRQQLRHARRRVAREREALVHNENVDAEQLRIEKADSRRRGRIAKSRIEWRTAYDRRVAEHS